MPTSTSTVVSEHGDDVRISSSATEAVVVATVYDADVMLSATARLNPVEAVAVSCEITRAAIVAVGEQTGEPFEKAMVAAVESMRAQWAHRQQQD